MNQNIYQHMPLRSAWITVIAAILASTGQAAIAAPELLTITPGAEKAKTIAGKRYNFIKYVDARGKLITEVRDAKGQRIDEDAIPTTLKMNKKGPNLVDKRVLQRIDRLERRPGRQARIRVDIALDLIDSAASSTPEQPESGGIEEFAGETVDIRLNTRQVTKEALQHHDERRIKQVRETRERRLEQRGNQVRDWAWRHRLENQKAINQAIQQGRSSVTLDLTPTELRRMIDSEDTMIQGIELHEPGEDDVMDAMDATSISNSALPYSSTRGDDIGIYMTESGCANESRITNYDRLSGSETNHSRNVGAILRAVSPDSYIYCRGSAVLPQSSDLDGVAGNPPIYIITRSNSSNDTQSYNTLDRDWDNFVYNENVAIFNSGGNTGNGTGNVRSPGKGLNVISIGNYNDTNDTIVSSSPFVDPQTGNDKPEVVAPGHTISAGGFTMTGTSQATPHAAAFAADMMSSSTYLKYRPYLLKAKLLAGATDNISGGYDKTGLGGVDFASAQWSGYYQWYSGSNSAFDYFDEQDGSDDGYVEKRIYISSGWDHVRVVLAWLNRGSYTYSHRSDAHPIGMDLDLRVYDPSGNYIGGSFSWDNPFEKVNFNPSVSGYYRFKISRYANRDTSSNLRMGLYVNYHD